MLRERTKTLTLMKKVIKQEGLAIDVRSAIWWQNVVDNYDEEQYDWRESKEAKTHKKDSDEAIPLHSDSMKSVYIFVSTP